MTPEDESKIVALCDRIGMPWERVPNRGDWSHAWNGVALNLAHKTSNGGTSDLVHDVAHWLVATPGARVEADFALEVIGEAESYDEEEAASLLGILIERALGMDWRYTWRFHAWPDHWENVRPSIRALRQRGLIRGLMPVCLLDATSCGAGR
jgi:hypothetical protein